MRRNKVATYLREEIQKYTKSVKLEIDFNLFTDRQIKNVIKYLRKGNIPKSQSATTVVARWLLKKYPMPHFRYSKYWAEWKDIPNGHPFFETLLGTASMAKLSADNYDIRYYETDIKHATAQNSCGSFKTYAYDKHLLKPIKDSMVQENFISGELDDFLTKLQNRTLGVVEVEFLDFADSY
jgi:hypothetical protein